jgi:hypothetical protein
VGHQAVVDAWARELERYWYRPSWWMLLVAAPWAIGLALLVYESHADRAIAMRQR